jgi:hypothetical protein
MEGKERVRGGEREESERDRDRERQRECQREIEREIGGEYITRTDLMSAVCSVEDITLVALL